MRRLFGILCLCVFSGSMLFAQVETNKHALTEFANEQQIKWKEATERVEKYIQEKGITKRVELKNGTIIELVDIEDGLPVYFITDNIDAATTTRANELWPGGSLGIELTGAGFDKVGIWDGGSVRITHQEFNDMGFSRVTLGDNASRSDHATHVAGTIVAAGVRERAKGMAYEAFLDSYDWSSVENEMATAAANGMIISNHSWGMVTGWNYDNGWTWTGDKSVSSTEDYRFGYYDTRAQNWDKIAKDAPYFLIVKSAGNDRGEGPSNAGSPGVAEKDGGEDGFDCISGAGISKNVFTIGAVEKVLDYTGPESVKMSSFSDWGPADDGRIKPDVVADGVDVYSCTSRNDTYYETMSGTSMAAPNSTGTLVLLHQYYQQLYESTMMSSTLKALVIHTADECGPAEGPDYMYGWGLINAKRAAEVIRDNQLQTTIDEITLENGTKYTREINVPGNTPLRATICWIDPEGPVHAKALNNRASVLINDLDLQIIDDKGTIYYPYALDPDNPSASATKEINNQVDNVEHIYIATPQKGKYTVIVDHAGSISGGAQVFSLIISGIDDYTDMPLCTELQNPSNESYYTLVNQKISWKEAVFASYYKIYFGTDGNGEELPTNIHNGITVDRPYFTYDMTPATTYYIAIQPGNSHGVKTECGIYSFTTYSVEELPYSEDVEDVVLPNFPTGWQAFDGNESSRTWVATNKASNSGKNSFGCITDLAVPGKIDNMLISPPIAVQKGHSYTLNFNCRSYRGYPESMKIVWGLYPTLDKMTNEIFSDGAIDVSEWEKKSIVFNPMIDGYIYLGIYLNTASGRGIFIDDILIEDNTSISRYSAEQFNIWYEPGVIVLKGEEEYGRGEIKVFNIVGQQLLETSVPDMQNGRIRFEAVPGIYVVNIKNDQINISKKIVVY